MWPDDYSLPNSGPDHPEEELAAFALNALDGPEFQEVARHVVQCLHCQEVLLGFQETAARMTGGAPEVPLPPGLKARVLAGATQPDNVTAPTAALPPMDPRWSVRRLRRWLAPTAIAALSLLLAGAVGIIWEQQREMEQIAAAQQMTTEEVIAASTSAATESLVEALHDVSEEQAAVSEQSSSQPASADVGGPNAEPSVLALAVARTAAGDKLAGGARVAGAAGSADGSEVNTEQVEQVKQEMAEVVEATMLAMQPETEKLPMSSPMGTEPGANGLLIVQPDGQHAKLLVSGMPADSYQVWLVRADKQMLVGRIVVNDDGGYSLQSLEMDESIFEFREVALMPDQRNGPMKPNGEKFLTARIVPGPPLPNNMDRR
jgi:hypothetical protein